jgi:SSS family solute:Na+ symporter
LYGGLSVAWTDVIQVIFLVLGGLVTTYLALNTVSDGAGMWEGMKTVYNAALDRFVMILDESNPEYMNLPIGYWSEDFGLLIYTTGDSINILFKRTLAAKSLRETQKESC